MKQWWQSLTTREQQSLAIGAVVLTAIVLYWLIWEPLNVRAESLSRTVAEQRADILWMESAAEHLRDVRGTVPAGSGVNDEQSLLGLIDNTARSGPLAGTVRRVQPEGDQTVRVWLENAPFDDLMYWLSELETHYGLRVTTLVVDRQAAAGRVSARVSLEG